METGNDIEYISKRGLILGTLSALTGSAIFTLVDTIMLVITLAIHKEFNISTDMDDHLVIAAVFFAFGCILSIIPGLYGGRWLARNLYQDALTGSLTKKRATIKGIFLGAFAGFCVCVFAVAFLYYRGDFGILIFRIISAIAIAGWMGGWVGAKLADDIKSHSLSR